ncbi:ATP-binding protein [Flavobacterium ginsenosidimutans]|uniref:ATP-binding protein n=1 Tax=Flavobacterium ginsenosidimutans TaxID=687844 RepID=UPI000DAF20AD|nr:hypothetical protein [Flavobacterium ginsenosidimutans]KAF2333037.1 hypothetical protein DM444_09550 [Flavobacterium ginsenosidimutans]
MKKAPALLKILVSVLLLLVLPTSCKKEKHAVLKKTDNTAEVKRLTIIADSCFENSDYKNAFNTYTRIISLSDTVKDRIDYVDALISLAYIYQYQGDYIQSEETVIKILPHLKYMKKPRFAWNAYFIQGFNYFKTDNLESALVYFRKALHLNTSAFRKWGILNSIGIVYMKQKKYNAAAFMFEKITTEGYHAQKFKTNSCDRFELMDYAVMLNNLGICYQNLKNPKAIDFYNKALKIRLKINDRDNISSSYAALSEYYLKTNPALANKYAKLGYEKASEVNFYVDKNYCLSFLVQTATGNELKKYTNIYIHFTDSINKARLKNKNQFSDIKYNFKKDIEENLELKSQKAEHELEMQRQKNRSNISYVVIFISAFILLFLFFHITLKGKKEKDDAIFKSELRISQKLHNELANDVFKLSTRIQNSNLEEPKTKEELLNHLDQIYLKTRKISKENSIIPFNENYEIGLKEMISEYSHSDLHIIVNGLNTVSWSKIERIKKITVFRSLQEIFDTMKKHSDASLSSLTFKINDKNLQIIYIDNNTKVQNSSINLKNRLKSVENRLKTLKGFLQVSDSENQGFKVFINLPL